MDISRVNLVYFSPTQSTQKILRTIASAFDKKIVEYDYTLKLGKEPAPSFGRDELVIIGSPVYSGRIPAVAESFYQSVKGSQTPVISVVVYGNRAFDDALIELCDYCRENGFIVLSAGAFIAEHSYGPEIAGGRPDAKDLAAALAFGLQAKVKLERASDVTKLPEISVSGNRPYRARAAVAEPWSPVTSDACIQCGICVRNCPMEIIDPEDPVKINNPSLCIHCCSCVKKCPQNAKEFKAEPYLKIKKFLIENCSVRREPQTY
jgi:ferredoxin/flavodoxin